MTRGQRRSLVRRLHRGLGWAAAGLVVVVAVTGILLHHPDWLGPVPVTVGTLAVDPVDPLRLLRGTTWGIEVSADGGQTWREAPLLAPPADVQRIRFGSGPGQDSLVVAVGPQAAVISSDGGRIWSAVPLPTAVLERGARLVDFDFAADGGQVLLTTAGLFRRQEGGDWETVALAPDPGTDRRQFVHDLHTGHLAGAVGRRVVEFGAWGLILLTVTGLVLGMRARQRRTS